MSDEGEKTCPLCAEEMDLTDQQLKPCKCGYQICVWCWHHIMDMAEKDESDGRCPACRSPYDKQKIVGMEANCERLVLEINMGRKMKNQKVKTKPTEGRKQLSSVRVIQRNLVYVVGLPLNLADENLLQRRDYFGQYGKVLKVSMSRTAAGVIQQFQNSTCSVYITYSKEEEAMRCIQNVHGFVLDDRPLRACFGTTKYCHAWLRNTPCNNPDCLYLHEVGPQEDSFTKDEIISAYTRNHVQQVTGAANSMQRRSGNLLPAPLDDYKNNSSGKPIVKHALLSDSVNTTQGALPNGSSGRSTVLPAVSAWGERGSSSHRPASATICTKGHSNPKPDSTTCTLSFSSAVVGTDQASLLHSDAGNQVVNIETHHSTQPQSKTELFLNQSASKDNDSNAGDVSVIDESSAAPVGQFSSTLLSKETQRHNIVSIITVIDPDEDQGSVSSCEEIQKLCCISLTDVDIDESGDSRLDVLATEHVVIESTDNQGLQQQNDTEKSINSLTTAAETSASPINGFCTSREQLGVDSVLQLKLPHYATTNLDDDVLFFNNQRLNDPEVVCPSQYLPNSALHLSNHFKPLHSKPYNALRENVGSLPVDNRNLRARNGSLLHMPSIISDGYAATLVSSSSTDLDRTLEQALSLTEREQGYTGRCIGDKDSSGRSAALNKGESRIITDILSMDFDRWEESLTSPHNLAKLLSDAKEQIDPFKASNSWKAHCNNQSKFSFARQEPDNQAFVMHQPLSAIEQLPTGQSHIQDFAQKDLHMERMGIPNNFSSSYLDGFPNVSSCHPFVSSSNLPAVSKAQISAPPGFSVPSRPPPPGFPSQGRANHSFDSLAGASLQNSFHTIAPGNGCGSTGDIEFMDPAILAVGNGRIQDAMDNVGFHMTSNISQQLSSFDETTLQLLMQNSLAPQQNLGFSELANAFPHLTDSYGISSLLLDQSRVSNLSPFAQLSLQQSGNTGLSNSHWDGWNEVQGNHRLGLAELLRNDRVGYNKFYGGYDDTMFRMTSSGNLYNRTYSL